jgi:hypothetical protein
MTTSSLHVIASASEAIHSSTWAAMDCFACARNDGLQITDVIPGRAKREPGISRHNLEIPDRSACRGPSEMTTIHRRTP